MVNALDGLGKLRLELESTTGELLDGLRNCDGAGFGEAAYPSGEVGGEAVNVILGGIQIRDSTVDSDPHIDVETKAAPHAGAEYGDLARNVKPGLHGALDIVLMCFRMAEDGEQPVALGVAEVAAIMLDDAYTSSR